MLDVPLASFRRFVGAERAVLEISADGLLWAALDEDVSVVGLLEGKRGAEAA